VIFVEEGRGVFYHWVSFDDEDDRVLRRILEDFDGLADSSRADSVDRIAAALPQLFAHIEPLAAGCSRQCVIFIDGDEAAHRAALLAALGTVASTRALSKSASHR
jgi:hypothetical protein